MASQERRAVRDVSAFDASKVLGDDPIHTLVFG
jgi:hypothetical protein